MTYLLENVPTMFDELPDRDQIIGKIEDDLSLIPEGMRDVVFNYVVYGLQPGHFLTAVLTNNLKEACARGDETNLAALVNYVRFFYWAVPIACWGSEEAVARWLAQGAELRKAKGESG